VSLINPKPDDLVSHKLLAVHSTVAIFGDEAVLGGERSTKSGHSWFPTKPI
jgi:hypothetical protein